jgi:ATP-dependent DNA helicase RecG
MTLILALRRFALKGTGKLVEKDLDSCAFLPDIRDSLSLQWTGVAFWQRPELIFQDTWILCRRFAGTDKADIFDHIEIH